MAATIDFTGQVVLVTGGTKGIGRGIAVRFAEAGATVAVVARGAVEDLPQGWSFEPADLRDGDAAFAAVDRVVERLERLDVVVNNAGGSPPAEAATASPRFTERIVALNLLAAMYVAQRANQHMQRGAGGAIVSIGSVSGMRPSPMTAAYAAAKAGLISYTATVAQEWAPKVRVNCVTAGIVATDQSQWYGDAERVARIERSIPMGRMASPADIGDACLFLASPLASYVTGTNLVLHGGGERPPFLDA